MDNTVANNTIIMLQSVEQDDAAAIHYDEMMDKNNGFGYIGLQLQF